MKVLQKYFIFIVSVSMIYLFNISVDNANGQLLPDSQRNVSSPRGITSVRNELPRPVLAITPREIDIGTIGAGESRSGIYTLKNMGSGIMGWSTIGPEGWKIGENQNLSSKVEDDADYLRLEVSVLHDAQTVSGPKTKITYYPVEIQMTAGTAKLICKKNLSTGIHREAIKITSIGGLRTIFVKFKIVSSQDLAQINLNPERMDMGSVVQGKTVSQKIRLTNKGREILKWSVAAPKSKRTDLQTGVFKREKYISFVNEEVRGSGAYIPPAHLKDMLDVTAGKWGENDGYPSSTGNGNSLKFHFSGPGVIIYFTTYPNAGNLTIYLDDKLVNEHDWFAEQKEKGELQVADGLADGLHSVTLVNRDGRLDIEGVKIMGKEVMRGPLGWINVFPNSGSTTRETEYINVTLNTAQLLPGLYSDNIVFNSNGGEGLAEVFVEVVPDKMTKFIDVFRYSKGSDYLFTANPQAETKRLLQNSYVKEGIAFRLFVPDTPGTTGFYRWYNPQKKDHFYHYDIKGGGKQIQGYIFEGSIGNIATSRITNTKELYRWFNSRTGHYFYTTDPKGDRIDKKGYKFDGIAGYVR